MHWTWAELMDLPADLYPELMRWLLDTQARPDDEP
jgi:hypothetical protein